MEKKSNQILKIALRILCILIGTFVMGCAYNLFYAPNNIVLSGFGGLAMLIADWLSNVGIVINMNIIYFALNIIFYIFAAKLLGKSFAFYTLIGIASYAAFLRTNTFVTSIAVPNDLLLCCLYGGVLIGVGIGVVVRAGGSTGGGDLIGCIANHYSRKLTVGNVSMAINLMVIVLSVFTYGLELALYAIIAIYISGIITDLVVEGPKTVKAYYIISRNYVEISNAIMNQLGRGVTAFYAEGMYTGNDQRVLLCIVYRHQIGRLKNLIYSIDNKAFVYSISVNDAMGKGFATLAPSQTILQKLTLKNNKKAKKAQNVTNSFSSSSTCSFYSGINVFDTDFKEDLNQNTIKDQSSKHQSKETEANTSKKKIKSNKSKDLKDSKKNRTTKFKDNK